MNAKCGDIPEANKMAIQHLEFLKHSFFSPQNWNAKSSLGQILQMVILHAFYECIRYDYFQ
jgi:hypothetical protein